MRARHLAVLTGVAVLLGGAAGVAHAADGKPVAVSVDSQALASPVSEGKTVNVDARRGRWGVTLNMQQPTRRESTMNDVQAGAYYRITPSLRVGGAVSLGDQRLRPTPQKITPDEGQPRVRLETKFKF